MNKTIKKHFYFKADFFHFDLERMCGVVLHVYNMMFDGDHGTYIRW